MTKMGSQIPPRLPLGLTQITQTVMGTGSSMGLRLIRLQGAVKMGSRVRMRAILTVVESAARLVQRIFVASSIGTASARAVMRGAAPHLLRAVMMAFRMAMRPGLIVAQAAIPVGLERAALRR